MLQTKGCSNPIKPIHSGSKCLDQNVWNVQCQNVWMPLMCMMIIISKLLSTLIQCHIPSISMLTCVQTGCFIQYLTWSVAQHTMHFFATQVRPAVLIQQWTMMTKSYSCFVWLIHLSADDCFCNYKCMLEQRSRFLVHVFTQEFTTECCVESLSNTTNLPDVFDSVAHDCDCLVHFQMSS